MVKGRVQWGYWAAATLFAAGAVFCPAQTPAPTPAPVPSTFSQPADGDMANPDSGANLPADSSSEHTFGGFGSSTPLPAPSPTPDLNPAWQKRQQDNAEWSLLTPEEIMGVQTPKQMFGLADEDQNASAEERYLRRQDKAKAKAAAASQSDPGAPGHEFTSRFDRPDETDPTLPQGDQEDPGAFSRMFNDTEVSPFRSNKKAFSAATAAAAAAQTEKASQQQAAEMARFRSLIGETPPPPDPALTETHTQLEPSLHPAPALDEFGRPLAPRVEDLSKPMGLTLPPDIVGYYTAAPRKPKKPAWEPQPPPWLTSDLSTPDKPPARKFY